VEIFNIQASNRPPKEMIPATENLNFMKEILYHVKNDSK
jgi:hypothetical protein